VGNSSKRYVSFLILGVLTFGVYSCALLAQQARYQQGVKVGQVAARRLSEISGLAVSRRNRAVIWVHNDSGDGPYIYAINPSGELLATFAVTGADAVDWEDIAIGPGPEPNEDYIYIADTGDNNARRRSVTVYRVKEPTVDPNARAASGRTSRAEAIRLVYPDGPKDAEALFVDPLTGDIYLISKRELFSHLYRVPHPQSLSHPNQLQSVMVLPIGLVTAADISHDGTTIVVRTMVQAYLWRREKATSIADAFKGRFWTIPLQKELQGEAIGLDQTGTGYYTIGEGRQPPVYHFSAAQ